jgi:hypothetical protein
MNLAEWRHELQRLSWRPLDYGPERRVRVAPDLTSGGHSGEWQTASTLLPSGSRTKAAK